MDIKSYIPEDLLEKYEFHNYNHALEIITQAFPEEWNELVTCLRKLNISVSDLQAAAESTDKPWPARTQTALKCPAAFGKNAPARPP